MFDWLTEFLDVFLSRGSGDAELELTDEDIQMCKRLKSILDLMTPYPRSEEKAKIYEK